MSIRKVTRIATLSLFLLFSFSFIFTDTSAQAAYTTGFENAQIHITTPEESGFTCNDSVTIKGSSKLDVVWFCIRGPKQELTTWNADVSEGEFNTVINLRFGAGQYTIWAGDNPSRFDGTIRFILNNQAEEDTRYTAESLYVDSSQEDIVALARVIAPDSLSSRQKIENIHSWITKNIAYDYDAYLKHDIQLISASQVLQNRKGLCRDFSFLFAALTRAANLPAKVVYGQAESGSTWELHAWNEVLIDNEWLPVDSSWDAGFVKNNHFVQSPSQKFLAPDASTFALTHKLTQTTVH